MNDLRTSARAAPGMSARRRIGLLALAMGACFLVAGPAIATAASTLAQEELQGARIAAAVKAGEKQCADVSTDGFELIGEYAMGRYLGSETAHSAMNRRMTRMMGEAGERRMHVALGYRYSGCSGGPTSSWVGPMAGMMGGRGYVERGNHSGTMMGPGHGDSDVSTLGVVLIALASAALGAGAATLLSWRRRPPTRSDAS